MDPKKTIESRYMRYELLSYVVEFSTLSCCIVIPFNSKTMMLFFIPQTVNFVFSVPQLFRVCALLPFIYVSAESLIRYVPSACPLSPASNAQAEHPYRSTRK